MFRITTRAAACLALAAFAAGAQSATVYSLANDGTSLVRFDSATPGVVTTVGPISGAAANLNGLDFRPANGQLYGYQQSTSGIYTVNTATGATTFSATASTGVGQPLLGIDFNPVPDRLRVVTVDDENRRINVNVGSGATTVDGALAYAAGDANAGVNPNIIDVGYTNSRLGTAPLTTQLFYIDYVLDTLATTSNPNGGVLNTVGALGVDTDRFVGFDILTDLNGVNTAFASLRVGGVEGLYTINLASGAASRIGTIGASTLYGLALVQPSAVPEPGSLALVVAAGLAAVGMRRRRMGSVAA